MVNPKYEKFYGNILENKKVFESVISKVIDETIPFEERILYAMYSLKLLTYKPTGYFYSNVLEKFFIEIAKNNDIQNYDIDFKPKTVLHVMTRCYQNGGHTRVVERWVDNTKESFKNSVILLDQGKKTIPELLIKNVKSSSGELIVLDKNLSLIDRAMKLREVALNYEYIVLHTHMEDPTATVAFGTEKFTRPVLFFNHADHMFWIGKTISDVILDIRTIKSISPKYRDIKNAVLCPIPCDYSQNIFSNKDIARKKLNIESNKKIILTSGSAFKFTPIGEDGIFEVYEKVLNTNKNINLVVIGKNGYWKDLYNEFKSRIKLYDVVPFPQYADYVSAADLIVDSYPMNGETTLIDAMRAKVPFLSLDAICSGQNDYVIKSKGYCKTKDELADKILKCFDNEKCLDELLEDELSLFEENYSKENWVKIVENIYHNAPQKHALLEIPETNAPCIIDDYSVILELLYKNCTRLLCKYYGNPNILGIQKLKIAKKRFICNVFLFNIKIFSFKKIK